MVGPEATVEREVVRQAAEQLGIECVKMKVRGWPDHAFMTPGGRPFFIEFKRPGGGELSAQQYLRIYKLIRDGYDVEVHNNVEAAMDAIQWRYASAAEKRKKYLLPSNAGMDAVKTIVTTVDMRVHS